MMVKTKGLSAKWYLLSVLILVVGFAGYIAFFLWTLNAIGARSKEIIAPGEHRLEIDRAGTYLIYYEFISQHKGRDFSTDRNEHVRLTCEMQSDDTGERVEVLRDDGGSTYEHVTFRGKRKGFSIFRFKISQPGLYKLQAKYKDGDTNPQIVLKVRPSLFEQLLVPFLLGGVCTSVIILGSAAVFWITFISRFKANRRAKLD